MINSKRADPAPFVKRWSAGPSRIAGRRSFPVPLGPLFNGVIQRRAWQNSGVQQVPRVRKGKAQIKIHYSHKFSEHKIIRWNWINQIVKYFTQKHHDLNWYNLLSIKIHDTNFLYYFFTI